MSLTLVTNPVTTVAGVVNNIFAGFEDTEFVFQRKDMTGVSVTSGTGTTSRISTSSDLSSYLSIGDAVYLYAEGSTYTYNKTGLVTKLDTTYIEVDIDYIENASTNSYINYFLNYYVEAELVNVDNSDVKVVDFSLKDDGTAAGVVIINVGIANDLNSLDFEYSSREIEEMRTKFKMQYKQVYTSSSESFTLISDEIILVYAVEQPTIEKFINQFEYPELYEGYPNGVILCHSDSNNDASQINLVYDELDLNESDLVTNQGLVSFSNDEHGLIFVDFTGKSINANTEYIKFKATFSASPDWLAADWLPADWATT